MNPIARAIKSISNSAPKLPVASQMGWRFLPRTSRNYQREVGDGSNSSIVIACVNWIMRNFPEAPLTVQSKVGDDFEIDDQHPMLELFERPNTAYSMPLMWMGTLFDWNIYGNAYWVKVRSRTGKVVQLWWIPATLIEPEPDPNGFILHYNYRPPGVVPVKYDVGDVVHFRNGLDPRDPRKGLSPLGSLFREIFTDDEASNFGASLLSNFGVPGVIITPAQMQGSPFQVEVDAEGIKEEYMRSFGGDKRGEPMILTAPTDIRVLSWSPQQMDVKTLRRVPEERVTAVLGLSAMVVGLGVGLEHSTYSNYEEAVKAAYLNNIIPTQRLMAAEIKQQLLIDFEQEMLKYKVIFDTSNVKALSENQTEIYGRANAGVAGGWLTVSEARTMNGFKVDNTHDVYLRSPNIVPVPIADGDKPIAPPEPPIDPMAAITEALKPKPDATQPPADKKPAETPSAKPIMADPKEPDEKKPASTNGKKELTNAELKELINA